MEFLKFVCKDTDTFFMVIVLIWVVGDAIAKICRAIFQKPKKEADKGSIPTPEG